MNKVEKQASLIKLSVSSSKTYEQCPAKFNFHYNLKLPTKPRDYFDIGHFAHAVLEQFHSEWRLDQNLNIIELMGAAFTKQRDNYPKLTAQQIEEVKAMLQKYLYNVEKNGMPNVLSVEESFEFSVDKYLLRGFIDRTDVDPDSLFHIVDYKTTKNEKYLDNFQLLVYGLALKHKYPDLERFRGSYVLLRQGSRYMTEEFNLYDLNKCEKKIIDFGQRIENEKEWPKRPSPLCNYCDFYDVCMGNWTGQAEEEWSKK